MRSWLRGSDFDVGRGRTAGTDAYEGMRYTVKMDCVSYSLQAPSHSGFSATRPKSGLRQAPAFVASLQLPTETYTKAPSSGCYWGLLVSDIF